MATTDRPTRAATRMGAANLASRSVGFVRVWVIAAVLGTTFLGNTYQSSNSVSNVLFELLASGALSAVLVPTFVDLLTHHGEEETERVAGGLLTLSLSFMGLVAAISMVFAPQIARLLSSGAPDAETAQQQIELATFLLRFFIPEVLLYVTGTIATGVLYAKREFVVSALAPIANTVVVTISMVAFWLVAGSEPGLDVSSVEATILGVGGFLGVAAFVAIPVAGLWKTGFRLRPHRVRLDPKLRKALRLSGWAVLQHAGIGILLGASIVMGNQVGGGVIAYQFAFVAFMAPYAILATPVHTTILPDITLEAHRGDLESVARSVRWGLDRIAVLCIPVMAAYVALALPAMEVVSVGSNDPELLAAALASLGLGLFTYSAFHLLARASYAMGDSKTASLVAVGSAVVGAAVMVVGTLAATSGVGVVFMLGLGHSIGYAVGAVVLGVIIRRRLGRPIFPNAVWRVSAVSTVLGLLAWGSERLIDPGGRLATFITLVVIMAIGFAAYAAILRYLPRWGPRREPPPPVVDGEATDDAFDADVLATAGAGDEGDPDIAPGAIT